MLNKKEFLEEKGLTGRFEELEKHNPKLWDELLEIEKKHTDNQKHGFWDDTLREFTKAIGCPKHMHSVRYRIKDSESLLAKIIKKKFENADKNSKYNQINADNYHKILTDLIGVRIIIRYRYEWQEVHKLIWSTYYKGIEKYIKDYEADYKDNSGIFIAEKPIVYYRHGETKKNYEIFGRDIFNIILSDIGYSSIHYIINHEGKYIELQVRTIYDEAWSECDHEFVYKLNAGPKKLVLQRCSRVLSDITGVADDLSTFIRDYYTEKMFNPIGDEKLVMEEKPEDLTIDLPDCKKTSIDVDKVSDVFKIF